MTFGIETTLVIAAVLGVVLTFRRRSCWTSANHKSISRVMSLLSPLCFGILLDLLKPLSRGSNGVVVVAQAHDDRPGARRAGGLQTVRFSRWAHFRICPSWVRAVRAVVCPCATALTRKRETGFLNRTVTSVRQEYRYHV
jgi:hypothetical protein